MSDEFDPIAELEKIARRQEQETTAQKRVETARARLILDRDPDRCFFKVVSMQLDCEPSWEIETAGVDGRRIRYNPEFISKLSLPEAIGVLCGHEPLHCAFGHHARRLGRDPQRWNIAADLAVNCICKAAGFTLPGCALLPGQGDHANMPPDLSAEEYYNLLPESAGQGQGDDPGGCGAVEDAAQDEAGNEQAAQQWERTTAQAAEITAKQKGTLPGVLSRLIENILHPKVPWQDVLRDFVSRTFEARDDYSWMFPNRHYLPQGIFLPGLRSQTLGHVVIHVDCSGSTDSYMEEFAAELNGVLDARPCRVTILYGDTRIQGEPVEWSPADGPLTMERRGGGGTCHRHLTEWLKQQDEPPVCVIALTDGETTWPDDPGVPFLWAITPDGNKNAPFGQVVEIGNTP
jgi:predicted metal-dependent peptidase